MTALRFLLIPNLFITLVSAASFGYHLALWRV